MTAIGPPPLETVWNDDNPEIDYARFGIQQARAVAVSRRCGRCRRSVERPPGAGTDQLLLLGRACGAPVGSYCREVPDVSAAQIRCGPTSITGTATTSSCTRSPAGRAPAHQRRRARMGGVVRAGGREPRLPGDTDRIRPTPSSTSSPASRSRPTSTTSPRATTTSPPTATPQAVPRQSWL